MILNQGVGQQMAYRSKPGHRISPLLPGGSGTFRYRSTSKCNIIKYL